MHITWNPELNTGIRAIDLQHQELVDQINAFHDAVAQGQAADMLEAMLPQLSAYALFHFGTEEALFEREPTLAAHARRHRSEHAAFAERIAALRNTPPADRQLDMPALADYLSTWVVNHIMKTDQELARLLNQAGRRG